MKLFFRFSFGAFYFPQGPGYGDLRPEYMTTSDLRTPVVCDYCQQTCQESNYHQLSKGGRLRGWKCDRHTHTVEYIAVPDAEHYAFTYSLWYRDKELSVEAYKLPQDERWELHEGEKVIFRLDYLPEGLTPDNIDRRLPTLLIFS